MEREKLGSRLGFILLSAGCAIGCGNVWKFPWMCGQYGGGMFVLIYLICLVVLGIPVMTMEFSIGRASQASAVGMYKKLEKPGTKWHWHGYIALLGNICLMAFYTVVCGWMIYYFVKFLTGANAEIGFVKMITNPGINITYLAVAVLLGFGILCFNLQGGLERVTKYMMLILFALMIVLAIHSGMLKGAKEGLKFYLVPNFSAINGNVIVSAMNQAFFTLSLGMGSMAIFGSYIDKEHTLLGESLSVIFLDTFVAVVAGLIIFPACFTFDVEVNAGPSLLFDTMASVFNNMAGGRLWGTLFFLFMTFASFSTVIAVFENLIACACENFGWDRRRACVIGMTALVLLGLPCALGYSVWSFIQPLGAGSTVLDFEDFLVSNLLLPGGSLVYLLFCVTRWGWGFDGYTAECNTGDGPKMPRWVKPYFKYVLPVLIAVILVQGL